MAIEINSLQHDERYFTLNEISKYLQLPKTTLYKYTSKNTTKPRLKGIRIGRALRFRASDVGKWLKELEGNS